MLHPSHRSPHRNPHALTKAPSAIYKSHHLQNPPTKPVPNDAALLNHGTVEPFRASLHQWEEVNGCKQVEYGMRFRRAPLPGRCFMRNMYCRLAHLPVRELVYEAGVALDREASRVGDLHKMQLQSKKDRLKQLATRANREHLELLFGKEGMETLQKQQGDDPVAERTQTTRPAQDCDRVYEAAAPARDAVTLRTSPRVDCSVHDGVPLRHRVPQVLMRQVLPPPRRVKSHTNSSLSEQVEREETVQVVESQDADDENAAPAVQTVNYSNLTPDTLHSLSTGSRIISSSRLQTLKNNNAGNTKSPAIKGSSPGVKPNCKPAATPLPPLAFGDKRNSLNRENAKITAPPSALTTAGGASPGGMSAASAGGGRPQQAECQGPARQVGTSLRVRPHSSMTAASAIFSHPCIRTVYHLPRVASRLQETQRTQPQHITTPRRTPL